MSVRIQDRFMVYSINFTPHEFLRGAYARSNTQTNVYDFTAQYFIFKVHHLAPIHTLSNVIDLSKTNLS